MMLTIACLLLEAQATARPHCDLGGPDADEEDCALLEAIRAPHLIVRRDHISPLLVFVERTHKGVSRGYTALLAAGRFKQSRGAKFADSA